MSRGGRDEGTSGWASGKTGRKDNTMKRSELREAIIDTLRELPDGDIFSLWNNYCDEANYYDDRLESMDCFDELFSGSTPTDIANAILCGSDENRSGSAFNVNRDYFYLNGYGNPVSLDYLGWFKDDYLFPLFDESAVVDFVIDNEDSLGCDELQDVLNDVEDDED